MFLKRCERRQSPQPPGQPHVAEVPQPLEPHVFQPHADQFGLSAFRPRDVFPAAREQPLQQHVQFQHPPTGRSRLTVTWQRNPRWGEWARLSEGCYLLRSNLTETDPRTLWKRYIQLTEAEWAFRITKDELEIRPVWHQKQERVEAHILVCFLAYVLWKTLAGWMHRAGLGDAPRTLVEEFARIKSGDVVLPTVAERNQPARTLRLRCVTEPDAAQKALLSRLGLNLPRRLRPLDALTDAAQM